MYATDFLAEKIAEHIRAGKYSSGQFLPSVRTLASHYSMSIVTVVRALGRLREQGLISKDPQSRRYAVAVGCGSSRGGVVEPPGFTPRHHEIADVLKESIFNGRYGRGKAIPSLKELKNSFGCSHKTITQAVQSLVEQDILERGRRRFRVAFGSGSQGSRSATYLIGPRKMVFSQSHFHFALIRAIEKELLQIGWGRLHVFASDKPLAEAAPAESQVAGYILVSHGNPGAWIEFLETRPRTPVSIIDFDQWQSWSLPKCKKYTVIRPDNRNAGREIAIMLRGAGHRRIAFFGELWSSMRWVHLRLQGLQDIFTGGVLKVVPFDLPPTPIRSGTVSAKLESNQTEVVRAVRKAGHFERTDIHRGFNPAFDMINCIERGNRARQFFSRALLDEAITAWVCANDDLARFAHSLLSERNADRRISLVGFDNLPMAYEHDITSYDFAHDEMGHWAVRSLSSPAEMLNGEKGHTVRGHLVIRGSIYNG